MAVAIERKVRTRPAGSGLGEFAAVLWRQRVLLLLALVVIGAGLVVGWQLAPRDYHASAALAWNGEAGVVADDADIDSFGAQLVSSARSSAFLAEVRADLTARLDVDRSVAELRRDLDVRWDPLTDRAVIEVRDGDQDVARLVAGQVTAVLPERGASLGIVGFGTGSPVSVTAHEDPATWLGAVLWVLVAWIVALLLASWRDGRTNTVSGAADVETALTAPVLAHVRMPRDPTVLPALTPGAAAADPFRHVRAALGLTGRRADHVVPAEIAPSDDSENPPADSLDAPATARLVVSSSPVVGPAPVWVATNLSLALAQEGWQVLVVDGRLGAQFGKPRPGEPEGPGLLDVLDGVPLAEAVHPGPVPGLLVAGAGSRREPVGLLDVEAFAAVAVQAHRLVDVVVVIAPALEVCDDALVMATPGTLLLCVPEGRVSLATLRAQGAQVRATVPRLLGSVLVGRLSERAST